MAEETTVTSSDDTETKLDEELDILKENPRVVQRELEHPETGEKKIFYQKELGFIPKLKFFRTLSGTLRLASERNDQGALGILEDILGDIDGDTISVEQIESQNSMKFIEAMMKLVELAPDFIEETYAIALGAKPEEYSWLVASLGTLEDEEGIDIIKVFIQQNGKSIKDFFSKHLKELTETATAEFSQE